MPNGHPVRRLGREAYPHCLDRLVCPAFSLPELLVVVGVITLLIAIMTPPLRVAHQQAMQTRCAVQLQQKGLALEAAKSEYGFYPIWDDGGSPTRYTWIDVLVQCGLLPNPRAGYCPEDPRPSSLNAARGRFYNVLYPGEARQTGIDYSYGISVPLSSGGWAWRPTAANSERPRRLEDADRYAARRVLAGDASWSTIYNLSGNAFQGRDWSYPTVYDNMVEFRHIGLAANLLFQDGHVGRVKFQRSAPNPIDTQRQFVWYAGESPNVGPEDRHNGNWYPCELLVDAHGQPLNNFPREMAPAYYTSHMLWTQILHK